jgi:cation:H+ antiporter
MMPVFLISALVTGMLFLFLSSKKAIEHTVHFASKLKISPFLIGFVMVSVGTDLPEIANSIMSCMAGHGDINVGDSIGSVLAQTTLVLGLIPFFANGFKVDRREMIILGIFEILALGLLLSILQIGLTQLTAFILLAAWPVSIFLVRRVSPEKDAMKEYVWRLSKKSSHFHLISAMIAFAGVALGSFVVIQSVIMLSAEVGIPEYLISFFVIGIGTSLPELGVAMEGIRKGHTQLVLGDVVGSCVFDALVAVSLGPLLFPSVVSAGVALGTGLYTLFVVAIVFLTLSFRKKLDRRAGLLFIILYILSFSLLFIG